MPSVLVIEDQKPVRESIGEILQTAGFRTRLIGDGQAALDELFNTPYDLITLDLNMPSLDGVSLIETVISGDSPNRNTPIIVISAYLSQATIDNLKDLGILHFFSKPFSAHDLLDLSQRLYNTA